MHNSNIDEVDQSKGRLMIVRIAKALDCPVDDFSDVRSNDMADAAALLTLWHSIRDPRDRKAVLAYLRTIADKPSLS